MKSLKVIRPCVGAALAALGTALPAQSMGLQSRATIAISASVMPRFRLAGEAVATGTTATGPVASNAPGLRISIVSEPVERAGPELAAGGEQGSSRLPGGSGEERGARSGANEPTLMLIVPD